MSNKRAKQFSDVITFAYWIRKQSMLRYKSKYPTNNDTRRIGRGIIFHIAPSNVAVNYAYSLVTGLVTGNINVVRVPSKDFEQIKIINDSLAAALKSYPHLSNYICLIRYNHEQSINDYYSSLADVRIIWGGDSTINIIRSSPMKPRSSEIVFADRYSFAVIDSDHYINSEHKSSIIKHFYNDTYLTDQNACSSPKMIIWVGNSIELAKQDFWDRVHTLVIKKYSFQQIMGVEKKLKACILATKIKGSKVIPSKDNYIARMTIPFIDMDVIQSCFGNSGFFIEYDAKRIEDIIPLCNNLKCQTITYIGNIEMFENIINSGCRGVDRIVPFGRSMDFDFVWDGYDLVSSLTRIIVLQS